MSDRKRIYLCLAHMSEEGIEQKYIKEAFDTNWVVPLGPNVNGFEADLEGFVNEVPGRAGVLYKRVVALSSGTAAVHLGLLACGVGPGDEVLVQSFTFCASAYPVTYLGATPVFVDSEPDTWNMDPELLEEAIKDRVARTGRMPKAIVPVALYGMPYRIDRIMEIADRYGIPVVEDAAEGFGSRFNGQVLGTFGKYGVLSFNGNKVITTSGGGALVCPSDEAKKEIMWYATQAREDFPYYQHEAIGYNYRMSNICAGIGRGQMTVLDAHIAHHRHVQKLYEELLADVPGISVHSQPADPRFESNYWLCTILADRLPAQRQRRGAARLARRRPDRGPPRLEAHAQAARLRLRPRLPPPLRPLLKPSLGGSRAVGLRGHLQGRHVPPRGPLRHRRRRPLHRRLHQGRDRVGSFESNYCIKYMTYDIKSQFINSAICGYLSDDVL